MDARRTGDVFLPMLRGVSMSGDAMLEGDFVAVRRTRQPNQGDAERLDTVGVVLELVRLYTRCPTMSVADDAIRFKCPACNKRLKAPPSLAGKPVGCSFCAAKVPVPLLESTAVEPPSNVTLLPLAEPDEMPVILPAPAPFADLTDRLPARRTRREVKRYDDEDDVPIRTRGRGTCEAGPAAVSGAFIGSLLGVVLSVPAALFFSQYAPLFGGFIQSIARPFSPARLESIPVHLLGCGLVAMATGAAAGAGSGYLGAKKGPGAGWAGCVLAVLVVAVLAAAVFVVLYFRQDYPERLK